MAASGCGDEEAVGVSEEEDAVVAGAVATVWFRARKPRSRDTSSES